MNRRKVGPAISTSSTSTSGSTPASLASISVCRALTVSSIKLIKKAGERPLSKTAPGTPGRKAVILRVAPQPPIGERFARRLRAGREGLLPPRLLLGAGPRAIPVDAVVTPSRLHARGQGERS